MVVDMVVERLRQEDAKTRGWLLDGYPRSGEQAEAIEAAGIRPDVFILINVNHSLLSRLTVLGKPNDMTGMVSVAGQNSMRPSAWTLEGQEHEVAPLWGS